MRIRSTFALLLSVQCLSPVFGQELSLKSGVLVPPTELEKSIREQLSDNAFAITTKDGKPLLTLWFARELASAANPEQVKNGLTYREVPEGTWVGALKLHERFVDFRKQDIAAGIYTLRLAVQPDTGDHKETAPHADFLLLSPANQDQSAELVEPKALYRISAKINDGDHPAVMLLFPSKSKSEKAALVKKADGVTVFESVWNVETEGKKSKLGFGLVVAGSSKAR